MIKYILFFLSIITATLSLAQSKGNNEVRKYYEGKLKTYLQKDDAITGYFKFTDEAFIMYASPQAKSANKPEITIPWSKVNEAKKLFNVPDKNLLYTQYESGKCNLPDNCPVPPSSVYNPTPAKPLFGYRIAIDPGHVAGTPEMADIEKKSLTLKADKTWGIEKDISLIEGNLTVATALLLQKQLEDAGAEVMLTRKEQNVSAFGVTFDDWVKNKMPALLDNQVKNKKMSAAQKDFYLKKATKYQIFHNLFKNPELEERVRKVNEFRPDLTVIIHYNVDETNTGWTKPTQKNFTMAFIGGGFVASELRTKKGRFEFTRMLFSDDLENSTALAGCVVRSFEDKLCIPAATAKDAIYLSKNSLSTPEKGVFCRNLFLAKQIKGTLVYGESMYQDNLKEAKMLCNVEGNISGIPYSSRVKDVSDAYYQGIINYLHKR